MAKSDNDIGGLKASRNPALDENPVVLVHTGETLFYGVFIHNNTGAAAWAQFFNAAAITDVTIGTTVPVFSLGVAANSWIAFDLKKPVKDFPLGMCIASTTAEKGDTGASQDVTVFYA